MDVFGGFVAAHLGGSALAKNLIFVPLSRQDLMDRHIHGTRGGRLYPVHAFPALCNLATESFRLLTCDGENGSMQL